MASKTHILVIDQGTTSTRSLLFDRAARRVAIAQVDLRQHYPQPGWVEHDPADIWRDTLATARAVLAQAGVAADMVAAVGIANQRETVLLWDRATGEPLHRAIVWQDRRTADHCARLRADGVEPLVRARTGLLLDPYFSATKLAWLLDAVPGARARAARGELAAGTVDSFLLWRLTGGRVHATDATNAARTLLFDIHRQCWDEELCRLFGIPPALLPMVCDNAHPFGQTPAALFGAPLPITGMVGDQQAALFGQACVAPGQAKATFGTGAFLLINTGDTPVASAHRLLTTPALRLAGRTSYALEGAIFAAGATVSWLRDGLGVLADPAATAALAAQVPDNHGVYLVPAFAGLGAPHWDAAARATITGLSFAAGPAHLARAALEAVAFQTMDLVAAMAADGAPLAGLRLDGGMAANDWLCGFLADMTALAVARPAELESTARGAAFLAGLGAGVWSGVAEVEQLWAAERSFVPTIAPERRRVLAVGWHDAVRRTLTAAG